jgi:prolipoprotein diacylglyceryltransferase
MIRDPATAQLVHGLFEATAMALGARYYFLLRRRAGQPSALEGDGFIVLFGCLLGAALGNKAMFWIELPQLWAEHGGWLGFFLGGQSMVGGLLGGLLGVETAKKLSGQTASTGDLFVFPLLLALIVGRIGCFLAGLNDGTFGVPTGQPWGVDFGDGIPRHPTQLYEIAFAALLWFSLASLRQAIAATPGLLFKLMLASYLLWRLLVDAIKPIPYAYPLGLSGIQWVCLFALVLYLPLLVRDSRAWLRIQRSHCR